QAAPVVDGVTLASVHAAKGLEWPVVFVVGASDGLLPISMAKTPAEVEEERRLFYVALTRARDLLTVSWSAARTPGARGSRKASRFLDGVLAHPEAPKTSPGAGQRRTGRRSATVYAECRVCGQGLVAPQEQRLGRHAGCPSTAGEGLHATLRTWRREQARLRGTPPYAILTDAALDAVAERSPRSEQELLEVPGIGPGKVASFGTDLLELLAAGAEKP
ncbi:MAG: HRDC domain-containing protein, partial [Brachybacterium sp.]|nr:HRDC domain-containing protein [Brachybacterium sp.]